MSYSILELEIIRWAEKRRILPNSTTEKQLLKCMEELGELVSATLKGNKEAQIDGFGDVFEREITGDSISVFAGFFPSGAFKAGGGVLGGIEEVGALDVAVAFFVGGVERSDIDDGFD